MREHIGWSKRIEAVQHRMDDWGQWMQAGVPGLSDPPRTPVGRLMQDGWGAARTAMGAIAPRYIQSPREREVHSKVFLDLPQELRRVCYCRHVLRISKADLRSINWVSPSRYYQLCAEVHAFAIGRLGY